MKSTAPTPPPGLRPPVTPSAGLPTIRAVLLAASVIVLAGASAYRGSFHGPFFFDDIPSLVDNPSLRHAGSLREALSPPPGGLTVSSRPVLNLSFALDYWAGGLKVGLYHATNLAIHLLAGLTLFGILRRTAGRLGFALGVALLWTLHPLQTESVTYIAQRAESLMGLFYLLTLYCFIRGVEKAGRVWGGLSVLCCFFGMGTKEVMVSAPLIVLLYDRTFVSGSFAAAWHRRRSYYLGLGATWLLLAALLIQAGGSRGNSAGFGYGVTVGQYVMTQGWAIVRYLRLAVWPSPLVLDYGMLVMGLEQVWLPGLLVLGLVGWTAWEIFRARAASPSVVPPSRNYGRAQARPPYLGIGAISFLGAWFFAILAPSSSIIPVAIQTVAEHRMYLSLVAVVVLVCAGIYRLLGRYALFAVLALAAASGWATAARNRDYRSKLAIWSDTVAKRPDSVRAQTNLGSELCVLHRPGEALVHLERAVAIEPRFPEAQNSLGIALADLGRRPEAMAHYREALRLQSDFAEAHFNLGLVLAVVGRTDEAAGEYTAALALRPEYAEAEYNLALLLSASGRREAAIDHYRRALRAKPGYAEAENNLGNVLRDGGGVAEALVHFQRASALDPHSGEFHYNLGNAWLGVHRLAEARAEFELSLRWKPDNADAANNLSAIDLALGDTKEAIRQGEAALRLRSGHAGAELNLANALQQAGRTAEALTHYRAAVRLQPTYADGHNNLAVALAKAGRLEESVGEFLQAIALQPGTAGLHENLGRVYAALGRRVEAAAQIEAARRLRSPQK